MDAPVPTEGLKRNRAKEFIHNALHKINKIKMALGLWSLDRRSRRSSNLPDPTASSSLTTPYAEQTKIDTANQPTYPPINFNDQPFQDATEPFAGPLILDAPGANDIAAPSTVQAGAGTTDATPVPVPCRPPIWAHLETALTTLENSPRAAHPLRFVARAILDCLDLLEAVATNDKAYESLASTLGAMANVLNDYVSKLDSELVSEDITQTAESIKHLTARINQLREEIKGGQVLEPLQNAASREILRQTKRPVYGTDEKSQDDWLSDLGHVEAARYNSDFAVAQGRRGCLAETRTNVLEDIKAWAQDPQRPNVLWMNGMLGTGKTTISYSLCEWLQRERLLGASYFCTRSMPASKDLRRFIPTIAYQLAESFPTFRSTLFKALEENGDLPSLEPVLQFESLLLRPLQEAKKDIPRHLVVVIDGLDEFEDDVVIQQVLEKFLNLPADVSLKIVVASRPEPAIHNSMAHMGGDMPMLIRLDEVNPSLAQADIKKYLAESLRDLTPHPTTDEIERLTHLTENLFVYAAALVAYISPSPVEGVPTSRLQSILTFDPSAQPHIFGPDEIRKPLYALYSIVLEQLSKRTASQELRNLQLVLWTVVCAKEPMNTKTLAALIGVEEDGVAISLSQLRSVLRVSESDVLVVMHTSFADFIRNRSEPMALHCDEESHSVFLLQRCFNVMQLQLQFNICRLESSFTVDSDIFGLERRLNERISAELFYACRYWADHLQGVAISDLDQVHTTLSDFLSRRLLFWMEVLNLRKCIELGAGMLFLALVRSPKNSKWVNMRHNLVDARDFVIRFAGNNCSRSTPHIYISGLSSCPRASSVYKNYWPYTKRLLNIVGSTVNRDDDAALALWLAEAPVSSLACSADGSKIASGSRDGSIRLWNVSAGTAFGQPIKDHNSHICSMKFSSDGTYLASGSFDHIVCLYEIATADFKLLLRLTGHEGPISALDFSPDGLCIASGSGNGTLQLWNLEDGALIGEPFRCELDIRAISFSPDGSRVIAVGTSAGATDGHGTQSCGVIQSLSWNVSDPGCPPTVLLLSGHEGPVLSVDISPDCSSIVTGGTDKIIRIWRADTGTPIGQPFEGHTGGVLVTKFSSDGTRIISGSVDQTVRVWDVSSGSLIGQPLQGHSSQVGAVVPLQGSTRIISGSDDTTIRLWEVDAISLNLPINSHANSVCSVAISTNNEFILSASDDKSVRVWNVQTGTLVNTPIAEYKDSILSVACSPDNRRFAAASRNGSFLVGDILPGAQQGHPSIRIVHPEPILSIAFSVDGSRLVTGSYDRIARIWDPHTLETIDKPCVDHGGPVTAVAVARRGDGYLVATGSGDNMIRLFDMTTGALASPPFAGHESAVLSVASSFTGGFIVSGSYDKTVRVWDGYTGSEVIPPMLGHTGPVRSVALFESPYDSRIIVSGSDDKTVRLWEAKTGTAIGQSLIGHGGPVLSVAFSLNGKYVVSGSADGSIRLWDTRSSLLQSISIGLHSRVNTGYQLDEKPLKNTGAGGPSSWIFQEDGWVTDRGKLLFWVPQIHHPHLKYFLKISSHPCSLVISGAFSYGVESWDLALGGEWNTCFNAE